MAYKRIGVVGADAALNEIIAFVTTDPALVALGQNWSVVWQQDTRPTNKRKQVMLKGPGLAASDEVFITLCAITDFRTVGETSLIIAGATGPNMGQQMWDTQYGATTRPPMVYLDNTTPMELFMVANGRRFIVVVKTSTVYQPLYAGLILPYATPNMYGYPLYVGGTAGYTGAGASYPISWRNAVRDGFSAFPMAYSYYSTSSNYSEVPAMLLRPDGTWAYVAAEQGSGSLTFADKICIAPVAQPTNMGDGVNANSMYFGTQTDIGGIGYFDVIRYTIDCIGGGIVTAPYTLYFSRITGAPDVVTYGILDGIEHVINREATAESTFLRDGVEFMVFPNVMRTTNGLYFALALE